MTFRLLIESITPIKRLSIDFEDGSTQVVSGSDNKNPSHATALSVEDISTLRKRAESTNDGIQESPRPSLGLPAQVATLDDLPDTSNRNPSVDPEFAGKTF